jgi:hypothetical protein
VATILAEAVTTEAMEPAISQAVEAICHGKQPLRTQSKFVGW